MALVAAAAALEPPALARVRDAGPIFINTVTAAPSGGFAAPDRFHPAYAYHTYGDLAPMGSDSDDDRDDDLTPEQRAAAAALDAAAAQQRLEEAQALQRKASAARKRKYDDAIEAAEGKALVAAAVADVQQMLAAKRFRFDERGAPPVHVPQPQPSEAKAAAVVPATPVKEEPMTDEPPTTPRGDGSVAASSEATPMPDDSPDGMNDDEPMSQSTTDVDMEEAPAAEAPMAVAPVAPALVVAEAPAEEAPAPVAEAPVAVAPVAPVVPVLAEAEAQPQAGEELLRLTTRLAQAVMDVREADEDLQKIAAQPPPRDGAVTPMRRAALENVRRRQLEQATVMLKLAEEKQRRCAAELAAFQAALQAAA